MAACGLQPGRKGSGCGLGGPGGTRFSRNSASMGVHNNRSEFQSEFEYILAFKDTLIIRI